MAAAVYGKEFASPCHFRREENNVNLLVHGDDFFAVGRDSDLKYFEKTLAAKYQLKTQVIGPHPDDKKVIFASNHHDQHRPALNFDLSAFDVASGELERITTADEGWGKQFDGFHLFSPDGKYLAFSSNRGDGPAGDTNVFIALWR